jgi:nucleoside phosphorylase
MSASGACDFLVVAALDVEADAVLRLLEDVDTRGSGQQIGYVRKEGGDTRYCVGLVRIGGMGNTSAQAETREAIYVLRPRWVLLVGIAAGFPPLVGYGDVLVPDAVVDYELAKVSESWYAKIPFFGKWLARRHVQQHRALAIQLSQPLRRAASNVAHDMARPWHKRISVRRPDGRNAAPAVHCHDDLVLGCGQKIVAAGEYEARTWLVREYGKKAIGLEMESVGALAACQAADKPFLVVKACQDYASADKDGRTTKDEWRAYACDASASFVVELIRRFDVPTTDLIETHITEATAAVRDFFHAAPGPAFSYTVSIAGTPSALKQEMFSQQAVGLEYAVPNDAQRFVALYGAGGAGKTRVAWWIVQRGLATGSCPVMLDLNSYAAPIPGTMPDVLANLLLATVPRRSASELTRLAAETRLLFVIDGLNEVSRELRTAVLDFVEELNRAGRCFVLLTTRAGLPEKLARFHHLRLDKLAVDEVQAVFDRRFGTSSFVKLAPRLRQIYQRPFFLALALRTNRKFEGAAVWRSIFEEFFARHVGMGSESLDKLAKEALRCCLLDGTFDSKEFATAIASDVDALLSAAVLTNRSRFDHELWRDYLVSRQLSTAAENWTDETFDAVTTFASSLECLPLTVEHISGTNERDAFIKAVYDWSYPAAGDCIREFGDDQKEEGQLSTAIRIAVLAAIAEKRFDDVARTRSRADDILRAHNSILARTFLSVNSRDQLATEVGGLNAPEAWYSTWKALYTRPPGGQFASADMDAITSRDSLIGWTASNLARRSSLRDEQIVALSAILASRGSGLDRTVRWRIAHALGAHPHEVALRALCEVIRSDPYHWARYGATRALVEAAFRSPATDGSKILGELGNALEIMAPGTTWVRRQILKEAVEATFMRGATKEWSEMTKPLFATIVKLADVDQREQLQDRIADLDVHILDKSES